MAGGSADAAAALVACDALWGPALTARRARGARRRASAATCRSCSSAAPRWARVAASVLAPVLARGSYHWVFALSDGGLSTPAVYAECDRLRGDRAVPDPSPSPEMMTALRSGDAAGAGRRADQRPAGSRDLADARARRLLDAGLEFGALGGVVSGSGPTVAFCRRVQRGGPRPRRVADRLRARSRTCGARPGRSHGAHVISAPRPG